MSHEVDSNAIEDYKATKLASNLEQSFNWLLHSKGIEDAHSQKSNY